MAKGFKHGVGGGASLNFDVKAYATEEALLAATPKENTIGVITQTAITSWAFSATEPAEPVAGMVWISTGDSSGVEFNALKKNAIQVYPLSAKQYVDGAWVDVTAMSYQGGEWVEWGKKLIVFDNGEIAEEAGTFVNVSSSKIQNGQIVGTYDYNYGTHWYFSKLIDVTSFDTLTANFVESSANSGIGLIRSVNTGGDIVNQLKKYAAYQITTVGEVALDISALTGPYYVSYSGNNCVIDYIDLTLGSG